MKIMLQFQVSLEGWPPIIQQSGRNEERYRYHTPVQEEITWHSGIHKQVPKQDPPRRNQAPCVYTTPVTLSGFHPERISGSNRSLREFPHDSSGEDSGQDDKVRPRRKPNMQRSPARNPEGRTHTLEPISLKYQDTGSMKSGYAPSDALLSESLSTLSGSEESSVDRCDEESNTSGYAAPEDLIRPKIPPASRPNNPRQKLLCTEGHVTHLQKSQNQSDDQWDSDSDVEEYAAMASVLSIFPQAATLRKLPAGVSKTRHIELGMVPYNQITPTDSFDDTSTNSSIGYTGVTMISKPDPNATPCERFPRKQENVTIPFSNTTCSSETCDSSMPLLSPGSCRSSASLDDSKEYLSTDVYIGDVIHSSPCTRWESPVEERSGNNDSDSSSMGYSSSYVWNNP